MSWIKINYNIIYYILMKQIKLFKYKNKRCHGLKLIII